MLSDAHVLLFEMSSDRVLVSHCASWMGAMSLVLWIGRCVKYYVDLICDQMPTL
jgi:hypothetical protein